MSVMAKNITLRMISTSIVYLTQYLQIKVFSFLIVAKVVFSFVVHLGKRTDASILHFVIKPCLFDHWVLKIERKNTLFIFWNKELI